MPIEIAGFAQALARCLDFETVEPPELEDVFTDATEPLVEMEYAEPSSDSPLNPVRIDVHSPAFRSAWDRRSMAVSILRAGGSLPDWRARVPRCAPSDGLQATRP